MAYNTKAIKTDVNQKPIPQYYNPDTDSYEVLEGKNGANKVLGTDERDLRGAAADKPAANTVAIGSTYWSVDTDPHADAIEVSDGTQWVVI